MGSSFRCGKRAFMQAEVLSILVIAVIAAMLLSLAGAEHRRRSCTAGSTANLQRFAAGITAFAADNEDRVVSFSWRRGESHVVDGYPFPVALSDADAGAHQAVAIMRTRGERPDISRMQAWFAHPLYNHLALLDYLDESLLAEFTVSPSDRHRIAWRRASRNQGPDDRGAAYFRLVNRPSTTGNDGKRWPFSSSYEFGPAFYSPDTATFSTEHLSTVSQDETHRTYRTGMPATPLGRRRLAEVSYPSHKAMVYETHSGEWGDRRLFFAFQQARPLILFADGSASVRSMKDANRGFHPNSPGGPEPDSFVYEPETSWEPPSPTGVNATVHGFIRWTRSGLRGRDFNGPEVPWRN